MAQTRFKEEVKNVAIFFLLLYISILVAVFAINTIEKWKKEDFLFVSLSHQEALTDLDCTPIEKENSIEIPTLDVEAPLVFPGDDSDLEKNLDQGVTHYPSSDLPGGEGVVIFLGHSAPAGWPHIKYDWVFSHLNRIEEDDRILIYYEKCRYTYRATGKKVLSKGQEIPSSLTKGKKSSLILVSCWPPGRNIRRIAITAELVPAD